MASKMAEVAETAFCITPSNPRALPAEEFAEVFKSLGICAKAESSPEDALKSALDVAEKENLPVLCLGSLYMYSQIISALNSL